jgi:hypothetical protein
MGVSGMHTSSFGSKEIPGAERVRYRISDALAQMKDWLDSVSLSGSRNRRNLLKRLYMLVDRTLGASVDKFDGSKPICQVKFKFSESDKAQ